MFDPEINAMLYYSHAILPLNLNGTEMAEFAVFLLKNGRKTAKSAIFWDEVLKYPEIISHFLFNFVSALFLIT